MEKFGSLVPITIGMSWLEQLANVQKERWQKKNKNAGEVKI